MRDDWEADKKEMNEIESGTNGQGQAPPLPNKAIIALPDHNEAGELPDQDDAIYYEHDDDTVEEAKNPV